MSADPSITPAGADTITRAIAGLLIPWGCLCAATTFLLWTLASGPAELAEAQVGMAGYLGFINPAALAGVLACAALEFAGGRGLLARMSYGSALCYLGVLKVVGWTAAPWAGLALAVVATIATPRKLATTPLLLGLHAMGTLAGLYLAFSVNKYLAGWAPFVDVLRGLWLLVRT